MNPNSPLQQQPRRILSRSHQCSTGFTTRSAPRTVDNPCNQLQQQRQWQSGSNSTWVTPLGYGPHPSINFLRIESLQQSTVTTTSAQRHHFIDSTSSDTSAAAATQYSVPTTTSPCIQPQRQAATTSLQSYHGLRRLRAPSHSSCLALVPHCYLPHYHRRTNQNCVCLPPPIHTHHCPLHPTRRAWHLRLPSPPRPLLWPRLPNIPISPTLAEPPLCHQSPRPPTP